jgi:hypothetical protein
MPLAPPPCVPAAAHVIVVRGRAAAFATPSEYEACSASRRPVVLGGRLPTPGLFARVSKFRLAGHLVGFVVNHDGPNGSPASVVVRSLLDGRTVAAHDVGRRPRVPAYAVDDVTSLVVDRHGATAWIVQRGLRRKVAAASPRGAVRTLDGGAGIAARSLRLHSRTLLWRHNGRRRSARL